MTRWLPLFITLGTIVLINSQNYFFERNRWTRQNASPPSCRTPDNKQGTCIDIRQCSVLLNLLKTQLNISGTKEFLQSSKCSAQRSSDVCCPKEEAQFRLFMKPPECGKTFVNQQTRIVGGAPAELGAWPWIALLGYRTRRNPGPLWQCGGALISDRHILTAGHCINPAAAGLILTTVRMGENEQNNENDGASPVDYRIKSAIEHPNYQKNRGAKLDDIGLITLDRTVSFTRLIQPICLPQLEEMRSSSFERYFPFVAGWGSVRTDGPSSSKLLQIQIPVVGNPSCKTAFAPKGGLITEKQLCAGFPSGGKDACQGDSGGPLMLPQGSNFYLIGVVSYGFKCAEPGFPGVYTRVTSYLDWIAKTMSENS